MKIKFLFSLTFSVMSAFSAFADAAAQSDEGNTMKVYMRINNKTFQVSLEKNPTARAFFDKLPFTMIMEELNGN
ncbi:hypothetical protein H8S72_19285 [Enterobacter ludwigii]|nr:hypothetical protein [Enterobacter ludwigii]